MSLSKKRPTLLRFILCLFIGLLIGGAILMALQSWYEQTVGKSIFREPFFLLAGGVALLVALMLFFPARKSWWLFKWLLRLVIMAVLVVLVFGVGGFWLAQNDMLYQPGRQEQNAQAALQQEPRAEEISFTDAQGARLQGWMFKQQPDPAGLVLYFGGNGELAAGRVHALVRSQVDQLLSGYHLMMVDYPGYGQSAGEPEEATVLAMAQAALDYARTREDVLADRIVLAGWSLGTGPATQLAANNEVAGLILMSPFYNGRELVNHYLQHTFQLPDAFYTRVPGFLVRNKYPSDQFARQTTTPALIIAGRADVLVPYAQSERLSVQYSQGLLVELAGGHTAPWSDPLSAQAMAEFLAAITAGEVEQPPPALTLP